MLYLFCLLATVSLSLIVEIIDFFRYEESLAVDRAREATREAAQADVLKETHAAEALAAAGEAGARE